MALDKSRVIIDMINKIFFDEDGNEKDVNREDIQYIISLAELAWNQLNEQSKAILITRVAVYIDKTGDTFFDTWISAVTQ